MKPRLILHIGTHKTGTTAIQRALRGHSAELLSQGVLYPRTDREPWPNLPKHCSVFSAAISQGAEPCEAERSLLLSEIEGARAKVVVLSEEGLSEPQASIPAFFAPWVARFDIEVVCFLRRPDLFVESLYNQFVREAARREGRSILAFSRALAIRQRMDYHPMLMAWRALGARVTVLDFDRAAHDGRLLDTFAAAARLPPLGVTAAESANRSPDMRLALMLAQLNRQRIAYDLPALLQAARQLEQAGRFAPMRHLLGAEERHRLLSDLSPGLERLASDFDVTFSEALPTGEAAAAAEQPDAAYMLEIAARLSGR